MMNQLNLESINTTAASQPVSPLVSITCLDLFLALLQETSFKYDAAIERWLTE
jgi:hypothetical protein